MEGGGRGQEGEGIFEGNFEELEGVGEGEGGGHTDTSLCSWLLRQ